jgi:hypothetical protein
VIEMAITGDGNDTLTGNSADNVFDGGREEIPSTAAPAADTVTYVRSNAGVDIDLGRQDTHAPTGGMQRGTSSSRSKI